MVVLLVFQMAEQTDYKLADQMVVQMVVQMALLELHWVVQTDVPTVDLMAHQTEHWLVGPKVALMADR